MVAGAAPQSPSRLTVEEFLGWDSGTDIRYELVDGVALAMTPPSVAHGAIVTAMAANLHFGLREPCRAITEAGIRLRDRDDAFYQADIVVQCAPQSHIRYLDEPLVIIEVLSPATAGHDRGRKGFDYREIPSVQEVVFLFTSAVRAEIWRRSSDRWIIEDLVGRDAVLRLESVSLDVPLKSIYGTIPLELP